MKLNQVFPSKYLKSDDLRDTDVTVEIAHVEMEEIGKDGDHRPVIYFKGKTKGLVCNKTNFTTIAKILDSDETDDWRGRKITLYATEVQYINEMVMGIRVRLKMAAIPKPPVKAPDEPGALDGEITEDQVPF